MDFRKDYYTILGVTRQSSHDDIKIAYRHLAKIHHPDRNESTEAKEKFQLINEAFTVLGNKIQRQVYDQYIDYVKQLKTQTSSKTESKFAGHTHIKEIKKEKQTKVYLKGVCIVKYWAEQMGKRSSFDLREINYKINPTDIRVTIHSSDIYHQDKIPQHYQRAYTNADKFNIPIRQPLKCTIVYDDRMEYYNLEINDILIQNPQIVDITKHENQSLGTIKADIYGNILKIDQETVSEEVGRNDGGYGETGNFETTKKNGNEYIRKEYYHKDFSTYWSDWALSRKWNQSKYNHYNNKYEWLGWLLLLPFIAVFPWFFISLAIVLLLIFIFTFFISVSYRHYRHFTGIFCMLLMLYFISVGFRGFNSPQLVTIKKEQRYDSLNTTSKPVVSKDSRNREIKDNQISHFIRWRGYDGSSYEGNFSILASQLQRSAGYHNNMNWPVGTTAEMANIYSNISDNDSTGLQQIYATFITIRDKKNLNERQFAEMIVSCIQSIPYYLVLQNSCNAALYDGDQFIQQYLSKCTQECCVGNKMYGIQSPVEFFGDLKGDCDTRSLLIYNILKHFNYKVAFLVSNYYRHAIIAVNMGDDNKGVALNINGDTYLCWETTSKGFKPGEIDPGYANLDYWQIALLNKKHY